MNTENTPQEIKSGPTLQTTLVKGAKRSVISGRWIIALVVLCNLIFILELVSLGNQFQAYRLARDKQSQITKNTAAVTELQENGCAPSTGSVVEK